MLHRLRRRLRIGVIPRRIRVLLAVDKHCVIPRHALPWTVRTGGAGPQKCPVYSLFRKINISFNGFDLVALRDGLSIPNSFCHVRPSNRFNSIRCNGKDTLTCARNKKRLCRDSSSASHCYNTNLLETGSDRGNSSRTTYLPAPSATPSPQPSASSSPDRAVSGLPAPLSA
jgi:hypothetical protein